MDSRNDTLNELQSKPDEVELLSRKQKATEENASQTQKSLQCDFDDDKKLFALMRQMEENRGSKAECRAGSSSGLRRSHRSTGSMPLPLNCAVAACSWAATAKRVFLVWTRLVMRVTSSKKFCSSSSTCNCTPVLFGF